MTERLKIFGWMADMSGCAWYRLILPLGQMSAAGLAETWFAGKMDEASWEADVFVAQRTCYPGPTARLQRIIRSTGKRPFVVFELDDDLLSVSADNPTAAVYNNPEIRANLVQNITMADLVTVSTAPLAERVSKFNKNVVVLPNCIPGDLLAWQPGRYTDRFTVGWQGSSTHAGDWKAACEPIQRWFNRTPDQPGRFIELHSMGGVPQPVRGADGQPKPVFPQVTHHRHTGWERDIAQYYTKLDWHVALAPLADTPFNRSKSDIRVVEAGMLGFPVVASDVPAYRDSVIDGETGYLVRKPADWGRALDTLLQEPDGLRRMSQRAKEHARTRTVEANAHLWLEAYLAHR